MNQPLENRESCEERYLENLKNILHAIKDGVTNFDIFADLVSSTVWKSPKGLAETWIQKVAADDWKALEEMPTDTLEEKMVKYYTRTKVVEACSELVFFL